MAFLCGMLLASACGAQTAPRDQAAESLRKGVEFFRTKVAVEGTYLWQYSEDLAKREGEGKAGPTTGWVQPPGTPAVGLALLHAYEATGETYYLNAAKETATGLLRGQLESGGWTYPIEFAPEARKRFAYRDGGSPKGRNYSTLDDDTTQCALRFMVSLDRATKFADAKVHQGATSALDSLLRAQYPNGAFPQGWASFPDADKFPVKKPVIPEDWRKLDHVKEYWNFYTLNDNLLRDLVDTLILCEQVYANDPLGKRSRAAMEKAGDFLILAQLPDPQPAWAQQYDFEMRPCWARKFEPPAVTGGESQSAMRTLMTLYRLTGQRKYLEPIPQALEYLKKSRLSDGRLARFYELKTNKPLYFTKDYQVTYDDSDMPTHYAFKIGDTTDAIARDFEQLKALDPAKLIAPARPTRLSPELEAQARKVIAAQDAQGRWVEDGKLRYHGAADPTTRVIRCETFIRNVEVLSRYLGAK